MKKINSLICFLILALSLIVRAQEEPLIKAGEAKSRKSTLAFPDFNDAASNPKVVAALSKVKAMAEDSLIISNYFQMMNPTAFLENTKSLAIKPLGTAPNGFKFDSWKTIGAEFLIRGAGELKGEEFNLEVLVYQIDQNQLKMGKKYKTSLSNASQIGFTLANDILEAITGKRGGFHSKLVATTDQTGNKEVVIMNWNGDDRMTLTTDRSVAISPNWSPDGRKLVYSLYTKRKGSAQQNLTLYLHDLDSKKRNILSNKNGLNSGGTFSPDGKFVILTISKNGAPDLYKINMQGDQLAQLTRGPSGAMNVEAAVSPDGEKIAFSSDRGGSPMIYVMSIDGSNLKRLTVRGNYNSTPTWSPDSKKIAFAGQDGNITDIFVMNADGTNLERVTESNKKNGSRASNEDPTFSPDGRLIAFISNRDGNKQIYITTVDGTKERRVTLDSYNYFKPKWSKNLE